MARILAEVEIQEHLNAALPQGWKFEPMVLEVDGKDIQIFAGVFMRLRLVQLLGIRRAWRVASLEYGSVRDLGVFNEGRRSFVRYDGSVLAGLTVLGLKPMRTVALLMLKSPDSTISARNLAGTELQGAITEAVGVGEYGIFREYLPSREHSEERGQATGIQIDESGFDPGLYVTLPYSNAQTGSVAQVKYIRNVSDVEVVVGVFHSANSMVESIGVHEVIDGRVVHTRTFEFRNGMDTIRETGNSYSRSSLKRFNWVPVGIP